MSPQMAIFKPKIVFRRAIFTIFVKNTSQIIFKMKYITTFAGKHY